jgi:hypothetical protein
MRINFQLSKVNGLYSQCFLAEKIEGIMITPKRIKRSEKYKKDMAVVGDPKVQVILEKEANYLRAEIYRYIEPKVGIKTD